MEVTNDIELVKDIVLMTAVMLSAVLTMQIYRLAFLKGLKISLRIAVLGAPRTGKTTLITTVFDAIMSGRIAKHASVSGTETVQKLTADLMKIQKGHNLGPTEDKDVFAYRYTVDASTFLYKKKYDVEIADFPGEYTEDFTSDLISQNENSGLFKKEFFSWVLRADKYIFVIDSIAFRKAVIKREQSDFIREVEISFKNAVLLLKQELLDEKVYNRPLLVVFTKCDNFLINQGDFEKVYLEGERDLEYNFSDFQENRIKEESLESAQQSMLVMRQNFSDLINFLGNNFARVEVVCHSSYSKMKLFKRANTDVVDFSSPRLSSASVGNFTRNLKTILNITNSIFGIRR